MVDLGSIALDPHRHSVSHVKNRLAGPMGFENAKDPAVIQQLRISKRRPLESSSDKCNNKNDKSALCEKPAETNNVTLPVVLGIIIPLGAALILFFYLHRRHLRKLRQEDANDPHKSLDFGMGPSAGRKKRKSGTNKKSSDSSTEKMAKHEQGMSIEIMSPYLLPPGLHNSRESLHSLSRTMHGGDDRYRPATALISNDSASIKSNSDARKGPDDTSSFAGSGHTYGNDKMNQSLLQHAQRMSTSVPLKEQVPPASLSKASGTSPSNVASELPRKSSLSPGLSTDARDSFVAYPGSVLRKSNNYLGPLIQSGNPSINIVAETSHQLSNDQSMNASTTPQLVSNRTPLTPPPRSLDAASGLVRPPRLQSLNASPGLSYQSNSLDEVKHDGEVLRVTPPSPEQFRDGQEVQPGRGLHQEAVLSPNGKKMDTMRAPLPAFDMRRLSMGFRPLPPDDPADNPEQRANRIRSFYKEYFDDSKPGPIRPAIDYHEDNNRYHLGEGTHRGQGGGHFMMTQPPFAESSTRRAMTPPPRGPPRFQGPARHHASSLSGGGFTPRGPRSFSSASNHFGFPARGSSRPALPPPGPLRILPSPHLIKEDSFGIPVDFAPPISYKNRQAGQPDSPKGGIRPYSPMLPAHVPLVSSFDDLSVMPSPHSLRKSGTFTALDFAPPPRFKNLDNASDSGSIRSNRSAMSAQQLQSIRAGAYRVSRIPKEVVGTRNETYDSLKPQWDMRA